MPSLPLTSPPESLCILRLSAIGDISHTLPTVRTLQARWPDTRLTWIIGKTEHALVGDIPGIDFIIFDKKRGWRAYLDVRRQLRGRRFDVLLHMQMALRASLISLLVDAPIKLGFDRARAKDGQWLFTNAQIAPREREHVLDSLYGFSDALGATNRVLRWDIPIPEAARSYAEALLPGDQPTLIISPCSSMAYRNWTAEGYAAVADYAVEQHGMRVVLSGGPSALERDYGTAIERHMHYRAINVIGQTSLKQLLALLSRATVLLSPDAGPAHLATAVGTPVIGLYACTDPDRARPYLSAAWTVNRYNEAVQAHYGKLPAQLPWGTRVRNDNAMTLIKPQDVIGKLEQAIGCNKLQ
ncbi:glycosyltransferase family 9 protein [Sulfurivermis fontis]|uniref:glycosyltransferase family 9 protein n=1 Tax=Sulfurivermis fontis TaxID=1972068 RepID=UPI001E574F80|nr:glycosyltransferase family 9 protein [Sulfurivermis fontis]